MIDYGTILNDNIKAIKPSGIRKFFDLAAEMDDVISLGVGEPDFLTPWHIRRAGVEALEKGKTRYTANAGLAMLREEISRFLDSKYNLKYEPDSQLIVTVGGSEGIDLCLRSIVNPGDEVIIPEPCFVCYDPIVTMCGGVPVKLVTTEDNQFRLTAKALKEKITDKTKALIMPFPNNPTGAIMEKDDLEEIAEVLRGTDIIVLSDEIYSELTYGDNPHVSIASIDGMYERTIVINGFSKTYSMTGWRLGYAAGPKEIIKQMLKLHQFAIMSAPTTSQYGAIKALRDGNSDIEKMKFEYDGRRRYIVHAMNKIGLKCFEPKGAFYCFPCIKSTGLTSSEFCERLIREKKVAVVPGTAFGECGEGYVRISYCYSIEHLKTAVKRISEFLEELKND